jgi:hypothetical protein
MIRGYCDECCDHIYTQGYHLFQTMPCKLVVCLTSFVYKYGMVKQQPSNQPSIMETEHVLETSGMADHLTKLYCKLKVVK